MAKKDDCILKYKWTDVDGMKEDRFDDKWEAFNAAAKIVAFNDICSYDYLDLIVNGQHYHYTGWRPGMLIVFSNDADSNDKLCGSFPHWDH